jgi:hypothetical protein
LGNLPISNISPGRLKIKVNWNEKWQEILPQWHTQIDKKRKAEEVIRPISENEIVMFQSGNLGALATP